MDQRLSRILPAEEQLAGRIGEKRLHICHLGKFYAPALGGMETHVRTLAQAQAKSGAQVHVVCVNHVGQSGRDVTWRRFRTTRSAEEWDGPVRVTRLGRWASFARFEVCPKMLGLVKRLIAFGTDVFHLHVPNPTMLLALAFVRRPPPLVITYHSDVVRHRVLARAVRPFEHVVFTRAREILSNSPNYQAGSSLLQQYADKVQVLPMGLDLEPYYHPSSAALDHARRLRTELGCPLWLMVGRLVYYKGIHDALHALKRVPGKLLLIGTGPLEAALRRLARELLIEDRIVWRGQASADEVAGAYQAATALWFPSNARSEGFGLVQVEAMASGCPVINTAIPASGVSWVSRHDETGLTIPMNDWAALAEAANRLLTEPGLRERLAAAALKRARQEFDDRIMAERSLAIYRNVLAGSAGRSSHFPQERRAIA